MSKHTSFTSAQRKQRLIEQGAAYRHALGTSLHAARENLQLHALAKSTVHHLLSDVSDAVGRGFNAGSIGTGKLQAVLPLLISTFSVIEKNPALRKVMLMAAIPTALATIIFMMRKKRARYAEDGFALSDDTAH